MNYYDRNGEPISLMDWANRMDDIKYKRVATTDMAGGYPWCAYWISTVWLGLDHSFFGGAPLIFETMAFPRREGRVEYSEIEMARYHTEAQAIRGHVEVCHLVLARMGGHGWSRWQMTDG